MARDTEGTQDDDTEDKKDTQCQKFRAGLSSMRPHKAIDFLWGRQFAIRRFLFWT